MLGSGVPLYIKIYEKIKGKIIDGTYTPGEKIPSEDELMKMYDVSRYTIRRAIEILVAEDLIYIKRGIGTFVSQFREGQPIDQVVHFIEDMESKGHTATTKMVCNKEVNGSPEIKRKLNLSPQERLIKVVRIRYLGAKPFCVENAYFPKKSCSNILNNDFDKQSLRIFLEENCNIIWKKAKQNIYAKKAGPWGELLEIPQESPVLNIERISYDQYNCPKEYLEAFYRGDMYYLTGELKTK